MLHDARVSAGITQKQIADDSGLSVNHISSLERGLHDAGIKVLLSYCRLTGFTPDTVLGFNDNASVSPELIKTISGLSPVQQASLDRFIMSMTEG